MPCIPQSFPSPDRPPANQSRKSPECHGFIYQMDRDRFPMESEESTEMNMARSSVIVTLLRAIIRSAGPRLTAVLRPRVDLLRFGDEEMNSYGPLGGTMAVFGSP
jgi:hypothetical protein